MCKLSICASSSFVHAEHGHLSHRMLLVKFYVLSTCVGEADHQMLLVKAKDCDNRVSQNVFNIVYISDDYDPKPGLIIIIELALDT